MSAVSRVTIKNKLFTLQVDLILNDHGYIEEPDRQYFGLYTDSKDWPFVLEAQDGRHAGFSEMNYGDNNQPGRTTLRHHAVVLGAGVDVFDHRGERQMGKVERIQPL